MTALTSILLRLYPRGWRARYEGEFLALVADRALTPSAVPDIVLAALDARISGDYPSATDDDRKVRIPMSRRMAPLALVMGGALIVLTLITMSALGDQTWDPPLGYLAAGFPLGFGVLAAGIAGVTTARFAGHPVARGFGLLAALLSAAVAVSMVILAIVGDAGWMAMMLAFMAFAIVSGVFGLLVTRSDAAARFAGILLLTGIVGSLIAFFGSVTGTGPDLGPIPLAETLIALLLLGWVALGFVELRRGEVVATA